MVKLHLLQFCYWLATAVIVVTIAAVALVGILTELRDIDIEYQIRYPKFWKPNIPIDWS